MCGCVREGCRCVAVCVRVVDVWLGVGVDGRVVDVWLCA